MLGHDNLAAPEMFRCWQVELGSRPELPLMLLQQFLDTLPVSPGTNLAVGATAIGVLLFDWDSYLGTSDHIFGGVRPAVRSTLNWLWGVQDTSQSSHPNRQHSSRWQQ